jgi:hypothetical protein
MTPIWLSAAGVSHPLCVWSGLGAVPLPPGGGAKWGIDPAFVELSWAPYGDVPSFHRGG